MAITLDRRITIQQATEVQDSMGSPIETWATYIQRWAKMESVNRDTGEDFDADTNVAYSAIDWILLRDSSSKNITEKMRLVYDGDTYDIDSVQEFTKERRKGYLLIHSIKKGSIDA